MIRKNDWQSRFGAKRRAIDRKLLLEVEREITNTDLAWIERQANHAATLAQDSRFAFEAPNSAADSKTAADEARAAIARAFGRPVK
jgi:hypothetical protein